MLEAYCREAFDVYFVDPVVKIMGDRFPPVYVTLMAIFAGLIAAFFIYYDAVWPACIFLLISGYLDVLDGAVARAIGQTSHWGTVLDIVGDRIVEFLIMFGLWAHAPLLRGGLVIFMLGATLICVTSFLVVGIMTQNEGQKGFHYSPGLIERAEAFIFFFLMILFSSLFWFLAILYSFLVCFTAFRRVYDFYQRERRPLTTY